MKVLVTGAGGFSGRALRAVLDHDPHAEAHFTSRSMPAGDHQSPCDLTDARAVKRLLSAVAPSSVYHLAGAYTNDWEIDHPANVISTRTLLESIRQLGLGARVLLVGSAAEYGPVRPADNPIAETHPLRPTSVYGLCKALQTQLMRYYCDAHGLDIVMARAFNLYGPGAPPSLFAGRIDQWAARRGPGGEPLRVGGLDQRRDYLPVDEAVAWYRAIMLRGLGGEVYNVGAGRPLRNRDLLTRILGGDPEGAAALPPDVVELTSPVGSVGSGVEVIYADIRKLLALPPRA